MQKERYKVNSLDRNCWLIKDLEEEHNEMYIDGFGVSVSCRLLNRLQQENDFYEREIQQKDAVEIVEQIKHMYHENENLKNVLQDFMDILNDIQYYFQEQHDYKELDFKDFDDLYRLSCMARDMLRLMNQEIEHD